MEAEQATTLAHCMLTENDDDKADSSQQGMC